MFVDSERYALSFEEPIIKLEQKAMELEKRGLLEESERLKRRLKALEEDIYKNAAPWERVQLARHPLRPTTSEYISLIADEFEELHGDKLYGDDRAVMGGIAKVANTHLVIIGHEKGKTTKQRIEKNFGMANPEGFRKALRLMKLAEKFSLPIVSFVDTPGAYPGIGAEERGQPRAIAENLKSFFELKTPIIVFIIGEGGSGGALALAVGDRVFMMEHAIYSVISPEGCAAILWKSREKAPQAAESLKLTAADCLKLGVIDGIIEETSGAAHRDPKGNAKKLKSIIIEEVEALTEIDVDELIARREQKYIDMGIFKA